MRRSAAAERERRALHELAEMHGIQTSYVDLGKRRRQASEEAMLALLGALGSDADTMAKAPRALAEKRKAEEAKLAEPVHVLWDGRGAIDFRMAGTRRGFEAEVLIEDEAGGARSMRVKAEPAGAQGKFRAKLRERLPRGYHRAEINAGGKSRETLLISAPKRAHEMGDAARKERLWGVFLPLYALRTARSAGAADFSDLGALVDWTGSLGGQIVATLPLLAAFLEEPCLPSPYSPVSRLFWNELYVDPAATEEFEHSDAARRLMGSAEFKAETQAVAGKEFLDYRRAYALKRRVLEPLAETFFARNSERRTELERETAGDGEIGRYAKFRGAVKLQGKMWSEWPAAMRAGKIGEGEFDERERKFHLYAQMAAREQIERLSKKAAERGAGLYLDYPLGVNPDGYDAWRHQDVFLKGVSAGAPPDPFFTQGQDWGFAPMDPERIRESGYEYTIACYRNHLRAAGILRIDHIMGLHRLFCIPRGIPAKEGLYLKYRSEELYAIIALESAREKAAVVGEDLGTVPAEVRLSMKKHGIDRMSVAQFEFQADARRAMPKLERECMAAVNTHDMYPFAAFWGEHDIADRIEMDLMTTAEAEGERSHREKVRAALAKYLKTKSAGKGSDARKVAGAIHAKLAAGAARSVIVNLEDLWGETRPQNTPGTLADRNWTRRAKLSFEEFGGAAEVKAELGKINRLRRGGAAR